MLSIAVAEFGDKTQLGMITLAASIRKPWSVFLGMIAGFAVVAGSAVLIGQALLAIIPLSTLKFASGVVFIGLGLLMLRVSVESGLKLPYIKSPFLAASVMIILTEFGDKTQIMTIALAAHFDQSIAIFLGVLAAFALVDGSSIFLADRLGKRISTGKMKKLSAVMFIVLGILTLLGIF